DELRASLRRWASTRQKSWRRPSTKVTGILSQYSSRSASESSSRFTSALLAPNWPVTSSTTRQASSHRSHPGLLSTTTRALFTHSDVSAMSSLLRFPVCGPSSSREGWQDLDHGAFCDHDVAVCPVTDRFFVHQERRDFENTQETVVRALVTHRVESLLEGVRIDALLGDAGRFLGRRPVPADPLRHVPTILDNRSGTTTVR